MDKSCLFSVSLFFLGNFVDIMLFTQEKQFFSSDNYSFQQTKQLDPITIISNLNFRFVTSSLQSWSNLLNAFAWFALIAPISQLAWVLSRRGKRVPSMHAYMVLLVFGGSFSEFTCRLMETGLEDHTRWVIMNFQLNDWETSFDGEADSMGWRVLEMIGVATRGFLLWIDTLEWIVLFQIMVIAFISVKTEKPGDKSFSPSWALLGLFIGLLCFFDFCSSIMRLDNWRLWSLLTLILTFGNRLILIPVWLIGLGRQLPSAMKKAELRYEQEKQSSSVVVVVEEEAPVPQTVAKEPVATEEQSSRTIT